VNVVKINSAGTVITTHTAQSNTPAPTIIQSTNNQHVTTTATLPASTKIEICQAPTQQQQQQQQQQHHQQNHQQQQHHQTHLPSTVHIQPVAGGQPQTIQLTTASGTATATAVPTTAAAVSAAQAQAQAHSHSHAHSQAQAHSHSQSSGNQTVTAQQIANAQVCIEPITLSDVDVRTNPDELPYELPLCPLIEPGWGSGLVRLCTLGVHVEWGYSFCEISRAFAYLKYS